MAENETWATQNGKEEWRIVTDGKRFATDKRVKGFFGWSKWAATGGIWQDRDYDDVFDSYDEALSFVKRKIAPASEWKTV